MNVTAPVGPLRHTPLSDSRPPLAVTSFASTSHYTPMPLHVDNHLVYITPGLSSCRLAFSRSDLLFCHSCCLRSCLNSHVICYSKSRSHLFSITPSPLSIPHTRSLELASPYSLDSHIVTISQRSVFAYSDFGSTVFDPPAIYSLSSRPLTTLALIVEYIAPCITFQSNIHNCVGLNFCSYM